MQTSYCAQSKVVGLKKYHFFLLNVCAVADVLQNPETGSASVSSKLEDCKKSSVEEVKTYGMLLTRLSVIFVFVHLK